jgi:hypothetical protein
MPPREIPANKQWANDLKQGDVVFISCGFRYPLIRTTVAKVNKVSIFVKSGKAFPRTSLTHHIDRWNSEWLEQATPELEAKYALEQTRAKVRSLASTIDQKTTRIYVEKVPIKKLLVLKEAMEKVCGLLDEAGKKEG